MKFKRKIRRWWSNKPDEMTDFLGGETLIFRIIFSILLPIIVAIVTVLIL